MYVVLTSIAYFAARRLSDIALYFIGGSCCSLSLR
jgi:hypothetical protein